MVAGGACTCCWGRGGLHGGQSCSREGGRKQEGMFLCSSHRGLRSSLASEARGEGSQAERWWCLRRGKQSPPYGFIALHSLHPQSQGITLTGWEVNGEGKNDYSYFRGE